MYLALLCTPPGITLLALLNICSDLLNDDIPIVPLGAHVAGSDLCALQLFSLFECRGMPREFGLHPGFALG